MSKTNKALMGAILGIALLYVLICLYKTIESLEEGTDNVQMFILNPLCIVFGDTWAQLDMTPLYQPYLSLMQGSVENAMKIAVMLIGFAFIAIGFALPGVMEVKGKESDPREYLFTSRPNAIVKCALIPWNIFVFLWGKKKVPIILPLIFLPCILPFGLLLTASLLVIFIPVKLVLELLTSNAKRKDEKNYKAVTECTVCPKCKRMFYKPKIKCKCGLVMEYPTPGVHGLKTNSCNNGHQFPCINDKGERGRLQAICPFCDEKISTHEARPLTISLVGEVGSGKTTFMLASVKSLCATAKEKGIVTEIATPGISVESQRNIRSVNPTARGELDSECVFIRSRDLNEKALIINDISGLEFEPDSEKILFEDYYKYNKGIVFAINPLNVIAIHNSKSPTKGSKTTPTVTLESFYRMFSEINGSGPAVKSDVPFAVVLTKMDEPSISNLVKSAGGVEAFLKENGQESFIRLLNSMFKNVKCFEVSSLEDDRSALEPLEWILAQSDAELKRRLF